VGRASIGCSLISATVLLGPAAVLGQSAAAISLGALIATPDLYANRPVTVIGRFRGRIGSAGAPFHPPNRSRWDFLLNTDDAQVWVSGIRPAGWDFDLDPLSPSDAQTGAWLEVTGTVRLARRTARTCEAGPGCRDVWIEASDLRSARAPSAGGPGVALSPPVQSPSVVFNDPINDEAGVAPSTAIRVQFSRQMVPETFSERIRIAYTSMQAPDAPTIPRFNAIYSEATRSLAITFASRLAEHQTVRVELLEGIVGANGRPLEPWGFVFTTGDAVHCQDCQHCQHCQN
jgi:Big-like domain-containing protein